MVDCTFMDATTTTDDAMLFLLFAKNGNKLQTFIAHGFISIYIYLCMCIETHKTFDNKLSICKQVQKRINES